MCRRGRGRELAIFAEIFVFAEIFAIIRFKVHNKYLLPGTRHLAGIFGTAEIFASGTRYQAPGTYHVL